MWAERQFERFKNAYSRSLTHVLDHALLVGIGLVVMICLIPVLMFWLSFTLFPEQDNGLLMGQIIADQSISFQAMREEAASSCSRSFADRFCRGLQVIGFTGTRALNTATVFVSLKPLAQRKSSADQVVQRLRPKLNQVSGARLFLQAVQDLRIGGRQSAAEYQYTLTSEDTTGLYTWTPKLLDALGKDHSQLVDVNSDMQQNGLQTYITIERATAQRYGFAPNQIDAVLYDAYGQRTVTTIFNPFNQYYVVMEVAPPYWQFPQMLDRTYLSTAAGNASGSAQTQMQGGTVSGVPAFSAISAASTSASSSNSLNSNAQANAVTNSISNSRGGTSTGSADSTAAETMVPLPAMTTYTNNHTATQVNHQNGLVASTISFNLPPGGSLSRAQTAITQAMQDLGMPASIRGSPAERGAGVCAKHGGVAAPAAHPRPSAPSTSCWVFCTRTPFIRSPFCPRSPRRSSAPSWRCSSSARPSP